MIAKKIKKITCDYKVELLFSTVITSITYVIIFIVISERSAQYERCLETQLHKFVAISKVFAEGITSASHDRTSIIKRLDELRNTLSWYFKISYGQDQSFGQIKIPIIVDCGGFDIESRKKVTDAIFDKNIQVYKSQIVYSKPFMCNQEAYYLFLSVGIKKNTVINVEQIKPGNIELYKVSSSHSVFSRIKEYWIILLGSFLISFFITSLIWKKVIITNKKNGFLLYRKRFRSFLKLRTEINDAKKKFFTSLNVNSLLTSKLSESAKTYVAMGDKTIHLLRQVPQSVEKPNIKNINEIIVYDIFRQKEKYISKIVYEAMALLSDHYQQETSIPYFFECKGMGVFLGDHDFVFFSLYLLFKEIIAAEGILKSDIRVQANLLKEGRLNVLIYGELADVRVTAFNDLEFVSVSFNTNKKFIKIAFDGVFATEPSSNNKSKKIEYEKNKESNVIRLVKF